MKDRIVQYPNRYKFTPVSGTTDTYDLAAVPGTVTEAGDDTNKANFLPDEVASALGLSQTNPQVKDAFTQLAKRGYAQINLTVKDQNNVPVAGLLIKGVTNFIGGSFITGADGIGVAYAQSENATLIVENIVGVNNKTQAIVVKMAESIDYVLTVVTTGKTQGITTSGDYRFLMVPLDICIVGAGDAGSTGGSDFGGAGGMGGAAKTVYNHAVENKAYSLLVGAQNGAFSSFDAIKSNDAGCVRLGAGGLAGDPPAVGGNSTYRAFDDAGFPIIGGGGGGGTSKATYGYGAAGGSPFGGGGGSSNSVGGNARGIAGGGGGGGRNASGGIGGPGAIYVRWQ